MLSQAVTHKQESLCESAGFHWKSSNTPMEEKKCELGSIEECKRTSLLYPHYPSPRWHSSVPSKTFFTHDFFCLGQRECEWVPAFPSYMGHCQRRLFLSHTIQHTESWAVQLGGGEEAGRRANAILEGHYRVMDLSVSWTPSRTLSPPLRV